MTAFDAPHYVADGTGAPFRRATASVSAQPLVFVALIAAASLVIWLTLALGTIGQAVSARIAAMVSATRISVFLDPQLSRPEAEVLGSRLKAMPNVLDATMRTREEGLAGLTSIDLPLGKERPNPLPDVWVVTLRSGLDPQKGALVAATTRARDAIEALPGVQSAKVDLQWASSLDEWTRSWNGILRTGSIAVVGFAAALLVLVSFVGGRALGTTGFLPWSALAIVGIAAGAASASLSFAAWAAPIAFDALFSDEWKPLALQAGPIDVGMVASIACGGAVLVAIGTMLSHRLDSYHK